MAIALVGSLGAVTDETTFAGQVTPTFGQATTSGNLLIAWLACHVSSATDPFGTSSTGWTKAISGGGSSQWTSIFYKANCGASESNPTFTTTSDPGDFVAMLGEFSGAATTGPKDQTGTSSTTQTQAPQCTATDTNSSELIIAAIAWNGSNTGGTLSAQAFTDTNAGSPTVNTTNGVFQTTYYYDFAWGLTGSTLGSGKTKYSTHLSVFSSGGGSISTFSQTTIVPPVTSSGPSSIPIWV